MKFVIGIGTFLGLIIFFDYTLPTALGIGLWAFTAYDLFDRSSKSLAFREFMLTLYGANFLLSPALTYHNPEYGGLDYGMKVPEEEYFALAIPAMLALRISIFWIKTRIFDTNFQMAQLQAKANEGILKSWIIGGILLKLTMGFFPGELGYVVYLISSIRYVGAFGLYAVNPKKYKWFILAVLINEMFSSLGYGMFHDMVIWIIFFGLFWVYLKKPSFQRKLILGFIGICGFVILQVSKTTYRAGIEETGGGIAAFQEVATDNISNGIFGEKNISSSVNRVNQAWILASTMNNMNQQQDFQGLYLVGLYTEAALLPRFLAPNKLTSGNKEIFRKFSGHYLQGGTSMGLGVLGDGYVAFGYWGTIFFCIAFGLLFGLMFKIVEGWAHISPFFILFILPIMSYAVRPDCETQTIITHLTKSVIVFGLLMLYYRKYFTKKVFLLQQSEERDAKKLGLPIPNPT